MKYLVLLLLTTTLYAAEPIEPVEPVEPLAECVIPETGDEDVLELYRSNCRQDEQIRALQNDVQLLKVNLSTATPRMVPSTQPSSRPLSSPTWQPPIYQPTQPPTWTDGGGRIRTSPDKGPK